MTGRGATLLQELFAELAREARERSPKKGSREKKTGRREKDDKRQNIQEARETREHPTRTRDASPVKALGIYREAARGERWEKNTRARTTLLTSTRLRC